MCPFGLALFIFAVLERAFSIHFMYYLADIPFISFLTKLIICYNSTAGCSDVNSLTQRETLQGRSHLYKTNKKMRYLSLILRHAHAVTSA